MTTTRTPAAPPPAQGIPSDTRDDSDDSDDSDDIPARPASARKAGASRDNGPARRWPAGQVRDTRDITPGTALFINDTKVPVKFTLRDEGNRDMRFKCPPGETVEVLVEYGDLIPRRAPHLTELGRAARPAPDTDDA